MYLLTGTLGAFACYEGVRSVFAFRAARTARDVDGANLRALAAVAFASLGSGAALRYVGIALFALLAVAYVRFALTWRTREGPVAPETIAGAQPSTGGGGTA